MSIIKLSFIVFALKVRGDSSYIVDLSDSACFTSTFISLIISGHHGDSVCDTRE